MFQAGQLVSRDAELALSTEVATLLQPLRASDHATPQSRPPSRQP
jgi:hypothetical protein